VQEAEGAAAAGDRTGILRFPVGKQEAPLALRFVHHRRGIFSALPYTYCISSFGPGYIP
jgi:hypothetical protein